MKKIYTLLIILSAVVIDAQVPSYVPTIGLVGYYPFNGNANDESGNGNNGTVNGATLTTDRNGYTNSAYSFDGNNDYIESICSNLPLGNSSRSISAWVNMPGLNYVNTNFITSWGYGDASQTSANKAFGFLTALNGMWLWQSFSDSQNNEYFSTTFSPNNYYHVVVTVDNNGLFKFFVNSVLVYTNQIIGMNTISNGGVLRIGRSTHTNTDGWAGYFLGKIDDLSIYNRELTPQEITNLYNSSLPQTTCLPAYVPTNGLVGYWPFCGNANDESGNGNNGTVNGATLTNDRFGNDNSAYNFANDYISLSQPFFNGSTNVNSLTYSIWFKCSQLPSSSTAYSLSTKEGFWRSIGLEINANGLVSYGGSQPSPQSYFSVSSQNSIVLNQWNHIIVTFENSTLKLYLNGNLESTSVIQYSTLDYSYLALGNSTSTNLIGATNPVSPGLTNFTNGIIDDFGMWNRALTQQEITGLYNATLNTNAAIENNEISIYPNPVIDRITIDCGNFKNVTGYKVKIVNLLGQEVYSGAINTPQVVVPINSWSGTGVYFVKIYDASNNLLHTKKIIVQ